MKNYIRVLFIYILFNLFLTGCTTPTSDNNSGGSSSNTTSDTDLISDLVADFEIVEYNDGDTITIDDILLDNNTWNKSVYTGEYSQAIFKSSTSTDTPFGWAWNWPNTTSSVVSYPELIYGQKPWNASSTTSNLPVLISENKQITVNYDITSDIDSGGYNLAFDIWLNSGNPATESNIEVELMIWLDRSILNQAGSYQETATIDGESYRLYIGNVSHASWTYIAFVKETAEYSGNTKINEFVNYLVTNYPDHVESSWYIASIELGNEIMYGKGITTFNSFSVDFQ